MEFGAFCFGAVIGWATYYILRYSKTHALSDLAVVIGAIGGGAVLALFPAQSHLFAFYSIGLAVGFFAYVIILIIATLSTEGIKGLANQENKTNPFMNG